MCITFISEKSFIASILIDVFYLWSILWSLKLMFLYINIIMFWTLGIFCIWVRLLNIVIWWILPQTFLNIEIWAYHYVFGINTIIVFYFEFAFVDLCVICHWCLHSNFGTTIYTNFNTPMIHCFNYISTWIFHSQPNTCS
jgi:hypothetical protein